MEKLKGDLLESVSFCKKKILVPKTSLHLRMKLDVIVRIYQWLIHDVMMNDRR